MAVLIMSCPALGQQLPRYLDPSIPDPMQLFITRILVGIDGVTVQCSPDVYETFAPEELSFPPSSVTCGKFYSEPDPENLQEQIDGISADYKSEFSDLDLDVPWIYEESDGYRVLVRGWRIKPLGAVLVYYYPDEARFTLLTADLTNFY